MRRPQTSQWRVPLCPVILTLGLSLFILGQPVKAQFVCGGSATGAEPQTGDGATAALSSSNTACGPSANASGLAAGNTAVGAFSDANGNSALNVALGFSA